MYEAILPSKTLRLWQLRVALPGILIIVLLYIFLYLTKWLWISIAAVLVGEAVLIFWYLPAYARNFSVSVSEKAIIVRHGVVFRNTDIMPEPRQIYATCYSSPLAKQWHLAGIILHAARGVLFVPELDFDRAVQLLSEISGG